MAEIKLDIRFGALAVAKGFITPDQLVGAMQTQVCENLKQSKHRLIGEILRAEGHLTIAQIREVLNSMGIFDL